MDKFNAHVRPSDALQSLYKKLQKSSKEQLEQDDSIIDLRRSNTAQSLRLTRRIDRLGCSPPSGTGGRVEAGTADQELVQVYGSEELPGLQLVPNLLRECDQAALLSLLLHRDLANPRYLTNIHKHYKVPYDLCKAPRSVPNGTHSFFNLPHDALPRFYPLDPDLHGPLSGPQFLNRKLRWMTLGGQYDWITKAYPSSPPPAFPHDIANYLRDRFPQMQPEAAIVNLYSPGDKLALHRDVSEQSSADLISVSFGCDGIFVAGLDGSEPADEPRSMVVRLRSGDAVVMSGKARYAWHGVPQVLPRTCPGFLAPWPAVGEGGEEQFEHWLGWMAGKRINLNVRQMYDSIQT